MQGLKAVQEPEMLSALANEMKQGQEPWVLALQPGVKAALQCYFLHMLQGVQQQLQTACVLNHLPCERLWLQVPGRL